MYFSSKLNIIDACIVVVTLAVSVTYTSLDLMGNCNNSRYTRFCATVYTLLMLTVVCLRVLVTTISRDVLLRVGVECV